MAMAQIDEAAVTTEVRVAPADYTKLFGVSSESTLRRLKIWTNLTHLELLQGLMISISSSGAFRVTADSVGLLRVSWSFLSMILLWHFNPGNIANPRNPVNIQTSKDLQHPSHPRITTCHSTSHLNHQHLAFLQCYRASATIDGITPSHHAAAGGQRCKGTLRGMKLHHVNQLVLKIDARFRRIQR